MFITPLPQADGPRRTGLFAMNATTFTMEAAQLRISMQGIFRPGEQRPEEFRGQPRAGRRC